MSYLWLKYFNIYIYEIVLNKLIFLKNEYKYWYNDLILSSLEYLLWLYLVKNVKLYKSNSNNI